MSPRKRHRTITTNMAAYILFSRKRNASTTNNAPPIKEKTIRSIIINFRLFSGSMLRSGMSQKMRSTTRKLIASGHKKLCGSNRNSPPNRENKVATTMMTGVILATNKPVSRFFSFGLFFPAIILCFPLLQGVKKACSQSHPACSISDCWHKTFQVTENRDTKCPFVSITWTISFYAILTITHLQRVCKYPRKRFLQKPNPVTCPLRRALDECAAAQLRGGA